MSGVKKYQVFVSSTFIDLVEERQAVIRHILDLKHIPAGMELFPAADFDQLDYIKKIIDECDYYVLILGGRYGSMDPGGVSYTEREYDYAMETGKVVLAFVHTDISSIPSGKVEANYPAKLALDAFREKVQSGRLVSHWRDQTSLEFAVLKALVHAFNDLPQTGWIRADQAASQEMLQQSNTLLQQNADLKSQVATLRAASQPKFDNLASLDENFKIRYRRKTSYRASVTYYDAEVELTWRQIFIGVAGQLERPSSDNAISTGVRHSIKEYAPGKFELYDMNEMDKNRIKVQLVALGLIKAQVLNLLKGGVGEFISLTPAGQASYLEMVAIRSQA